MGKLYTILGGITIVMILIAFSLTSNDIERCIERGHLPETCYSTYN